MSLSSRVSKFPCRNAGRLWWVTLGLTLVTLVPVWAQGNSQEARLFHAPNGNLESGHLMTVPMASMSGHQAHGDNRICFSGSQCLFDGIQNLGLGGAQLALNGVGNLIVSNVDGSGTTGVRQDPLPFDSQEMITGIACPNFLASAEGTAGVFIMYADVPGDVFSVLTVENLGPGANGQDVMRAHGDFSPIGTTKYTIRVFNDGALVADLTGLDDPTVLFPKDDIREIDCSIDGTITYEKTKPDIITVVAAGQQVVGDRFCFMAEDAKVEGTRQTAIDNFLINTGPVEMTFQYAGPFLNHQP